MFRALRGLLSPQSVEIVGHPRFLPPSLVPVEEAPCKSNCPLTDGELPILEEARVAGDEEVVRLIETGIEDREKRCLGAVMLRGDEKYRCGLMNGNER